MVWSDFNKNYFSASVFSFFLPAVSQFIFVPFIHWLDISEFHMIKISSAPVELAKSLPQPLSC